MNTSLLAASGYFRELSLEGVDDRAQDFGIDQSIFPSLELAHRRL
jgi:hypothetical protein